MSGSDTPNSDTPNVSDSHRHASDDAHWCFAWFQADLPQTGNEKAALVKDSKWPERSRISISFLDGTDAQKALVKKFAPIWITDLANLEFEWGPPPQTDIRISFKYPGSWSVLGTTAKKIPLMQPTMNFGWLNPGISDTAARSVILHEFGHALGLIHEHQNPFGAIEWNKEIVRASLSGPPNNWSPAVIQHNMFEEYQQAVVDGTTLDATSIMMYAFPETWVKSGQATPFNSDLSASDRDFIKKMYP